MEHLFALDVEHPFVLIWEHLFDPSAVGGPRPGPTVRAPGDDAPMAAVVHLEPVPLDTAGHPRLVLVERPAPRRRAQPATLDRRRRLVTLVAAAVVVAVTWWGLSPLFVSASAEPVVVGREVVVGPGDTLWQLAVDLDVEGDVRDAMARLVEANGGASLRPGQVVVVPQDLLD